MEFVFPCLVEQSETECTRGHKWCWKVFCEACCYQNTLFETTSIETFQGEFKFQTFLLTTSTWHWKAEVTKHPFGASVFTANFHHVGKSQHSEQYHSQKQGTSDNDILTKYWLIFSKQQRLVWTNYSAWSFTIRVE